MLKRYAVFVSALHCAADITITVAIWLGVYFIRFQSGAFDVYKGVPGFERHLALTVPVVAICCLSCAWAGLYRPKRRKNMFIQFGDLFKAVVFGAVFTLAFFYYVQDVPYSRKLLAIFFPMLLAGLALSHWLLMVLMRQLRKKGYNLRHYVVVGAGTSGQQLVRDIEQAGWLGLKCAFFVENDPELIGTRVAGLPVRGPLDRLSKIVAEAGVDEVYLAMKGDDAQLAYSKLEKLVFDGVTVRIVPDWGGLASTSAGSVMTVGTQVLFSAADSPLNGANVLLKEAFDRIAALLLLAVFSVPMVLISIAIKLNGRGPVFYRQTRVGMDQRQFGMLKFRTMTRGCDREGGWTERNDPRRTCVGALLRRMSLDELPQLFNVLCGQMSLVGPRPEQPQFVRQFFDEYRRYMLRHKVKAGMTGWAQVHGLRGDTSPRKRLLYDLYYVRNWSFGLDMWILLRTPWDVIKGRNAY